MDTLLRYTGKDDFTNQLLLMEQYDQYFEIWDHENGDPSDQLAVIGMHPAEDPVTGSKMETLARELISSRLCEATNTPLLQLMNYPRWFLDSLLKDSRIARVKEAEAQAELDRLATNATNAANR